MGATVNGAAISVPFRCKRAVIGIGSSPTSTSIDPEFTLDECRVSIASVGPGHMTFSRRMGTVHHPHESSFGTKQPDYTLLGKWATLKLSGQTGVARSVFTGIVVTESSGLHGTDEGRTGVQRWTALDPLHLLERVQVGRTYGIEGAGSSTLVTLTRVAPFNLRDSYGTLVGNRSSSQVGDSYVFGGSGTWTRRQAVEYLLDRFAPTTHGTWSITGATELLDAAADVIDMGQSDSLGSAIRRIIPPQMGMDFVIESTSAGFSLRVVSLVSTDVSVLGLTLPANPSNVTFVAGSRQDVRRVEFTRTQYRRYSTLRVLGERAVVCTTFKASDGSLVPKWSSSLEATYLAGTGTGSDDASLHDAARRVPRLAHVFTSYGAPHPFKLSTVNAGLSFDADGALDSVGAAHSDLVRKTETWLPLRSGYDYSSGTETSEVITNHESDLRRPMAWVQDPDSSRYVTVEEAGFGMAVPRNDWGVELRGRDNHVLALNNFSGANDTGAAPVYDYDTLVATLCLRTDVRLAIEVEIDPSGDGSVLEVTVPGAEYWLAAKGTAVGVSQAGSLQTLSSALELRNDRDALAAVAVGLIASYLMSSSAASVELQGYHSYGSVVGSMLTSISQGGRAEQVSAPITSVLYSGGTSPRTFVQAGYVE